MRSGALRQAKILIIDDEDSMVELLREVLGGEGYGALASTTDPLAAVALFQEFQPDLVVLDLLMPGRNGLEVLADLRALIPAAAYLPILVITADPTMKARREALGRGASDFVTKPCDPAEFLARIGHLLETRSLHLQLAAKHGELETILAQLLAANAQMRVESRERSLAEAVLRETAERANAAKGEFLSRMSHELRTPLNAILGFGQLLEREGREPEEADNIEQILTAGRHLLGLVNELGRPFWLEAPLGEGPSPRAPSSNPNAEILDPRTLLYLEDNLATLRLTTRILARRPAIRLLSAATGALGLEMARAQRPDLILLDLHQPADHGDAVLALLRADPRTAEIPVLLLRTGDRPGQGEPMQPAGPHTWVLMKPVAVRTLLGVMDRFLAEEGT